MTDSEWCLIESDPSIFTELISNFGVKGISVEELISTDIESLALFERVYGLILLFKHSKKTVSAASGACIPDGQHNLFFAKQVVSNACATFALLNILMNYQGEGNVDLGDNLRQLGAITESLSSDLKGSAIGQSEFIRVAHNAYMPVDVITSHNQSSDSDAYHFVSFVYKNGAIWELDGLREGPLRSADSNDELYKEALIKTVQDRIEAIGKMDTSGSGQGISFALLAVVDDPIELLQKKIALEESQGNDTLYLKEELNHLMNSRAKEKHENTRRKFNYIPMIIELMKALAEKGELKGIIDELEDKAKS